MFWYPHPSHAEKILRTHIYLLAGLSVKRSRVATQLCLVVLSNSGGKVSH